MHGASRAGATPGWIRVVLLASSALALACGGTSSQPNERVDTSSAGTGGSAGAAASAGAAGATALGGSGGALSAAGSSSNAAGATLGGANAGGATTAGAGGSGGSVPKERAVCLVEAKKACVVALVASKATSDAACAGESGGTVVARCPSENLIGCCAFPEADLNDCFYAGTTVGITKAICLELGRTWSDTVPP